MTDLASLRAQLAGLLPELINGWWCILKYSWSVRFMALSFFIIVAEPVITFLVGLYTGPSIWLSVGLQTLAGLTALAGIYARIIAQDKLETIIITNKSDK